MKPGKGYSANHCSNLEYRETFMVLGQENTGASVTETALSMSQVLGSSSVHIDSQRPLGSCVVNPILQVRILRWQS